MNEWQDINRDQAENPPATMRSEDGALPSKPEPVYEYRVVCADGEWRWGAAIRPKNDRSQAERSRDQASSKSGCSCDGSMEDRPNNHTIESRSVGPWGAT